MISRRSVVAGMLAVPFSPAAGAQKVSLAIGEVSGAGADDPKAIADRFALYRSLGFNALRYALIWSMFEQEPDTWRLSDDQRRYFDLALEHGFGLKLEIGAWSSVPDWFLDQHPLARMVDADGRFKRQYLSPWYQGARELLVEKQSRVIESIAGLGLSDSVVGAIVDLGPAGEPLYPPAWTVPGETQDSFWFYGPTAVEAFRTAMRAKFGDDLARANGRWATHLRAWSDLAPQMAGGPVFWHDVLIWYRDTKRDMVTALVTDFKRTALRTGFKAPLIALLPGSHQPSTLLDDDPDLAGASGAVRVMTDWPFLFDLCLGQKIDMQYTAAEQASEVASIGACLNRRGAGDVLWLENAGGPPSLRPEDLVSAARRAPHKGYDYIGAGSLFDRSGRPEPEICGRVKAMLDAMKAQPHPAEGPRTRG